MVGFHGRKGGVSAAGKKAVGLCSWGLLMVPPEMCAHWSTRADTYSVHECLSVQRVQKESILGEISFMLFAVKHKVMLRSM